VSVQLSTSDDDMINAVDIFSPDIIICPYLTKFIPKNIYENIPTFILHPGILGDKGPHSLDHAILEQKKSWGVTLIRANGEFDGGDVYAAIDFEMRDTKKSSLYRREVSSSASKAVKKLLQDIESNTTQITKQLPTSMHKRLTQQDRAIEWFRDSSETIARKINAADSYPGVKDELVGIECYLFGAKVESFLNDEKLQEACRKSHLKEIFAKRDGAVCIKTVDGAIWISHLKEIGRFKLPSTYVLKDKIRGVKEFRLPLILEKQHSTFYEIYLEMKGDVAYLYFNFYNGAFSCEQSIRLKYAIESMVDRCKVLVLMGGDEFFSNGIHLNILEDSKKQGEDGWSNINAMNDMVRSSLLSDDFITISAIRGGAGAGGLFFALSCDYVIARDGVVLNPHYKTIGLSGSEFHTYTLPKRVGETLAQKLLDEALPLNASMAKKIGLIDEVFSEDMDLFFEELDKFAQDLVKDEDKWYDIIDKKRDLLEEDIERIEYYHKQELEKMYPEFWDKSSEFHKLRSDFVYKICPTTTPERLIYKEDKCMNIV
jgi:putative two-component system hydrogenase maturation factor HypX/HoxX